MNTEDEVYTFDADPGAEECNDVVVSHHYSHLVPSAVVYRAGFRNTAGDLVAAVLFSVPSTRWGEPVRELARLVRRPDCRPHLSALIGKACHELKRRKIADLVVSFADSTQSHHGGVYQASSWAYHEKRKARIDGFILGGDFVHARVCNHRYGTSSSPRLREIFEVIGVSFSEHWDTGKHLYWRPLTPKGSAQATALGLKSMPYCKPANTPS